MASDKARRVICYKERLTMYRYRLLILLLLIVAAVPVFGAMAQDATPTISLETNFSAADAIVSTPPAYTLSILVQ